MPVSPRNKLSFCRFLPEINQVFAGLFLFPFQIFSGNEFVVTGINQTKNGINGVGKRDDRGDTGDFPGFPANPNKFPVTHPSMVETIDYIISFFTRSRLTTSRHPNCRCLNQTFPFSVVWLVDSNESAQLSSIHLVFMKIIAQGKRLRKGLAFAGWSKANQEQNPIMI